ncbi:MAG: glycosyltransferase family 4 protein [Pseudomonadota bacterium]
MRWESIARETVLDASEMFTTSRTCHDAPVKIAHLEFGRHNYGGAAQVRYLLDAMRDGDHEHVLVTPESSALQQWSVRQGQAHLALRYAGEHDLFAVLRLARWLRRESIDLVHVHSRRGADWLGPLACAFARCPAILTRRVDNVPGGFLRWLMRGRFRRVVAISDAIADVLKAAAVPEELLLTIRSAVDSDTLGAAPQTDVRSILADCSEDTPVIGVVAQLIDRKGHRFLIEGLPGLRDRFPGLRVVFFGQGPLESELRAQVANLGLSDTVVFAGFRDDLVQLMGSLTLLVHPALKEGLGVSLLQAGALGVPVVGFKAGGVVEVVAHEHTGLLVSPGDSVALAAAIGHLLGDPDLRAKMGANASRRVAESFSIERMVQRYAALYDVLAGEVT